MLIFSYFKFSFYVVLCKLHYHSRLYIVRVKYTQARPRPFTRQIMFIYINVQILYIENKDTKWTE
jgi:hypothetical protein